MNKPKDEMMNRDEHFMRRALHMASCALEQREVPIGCVVVWNGDVIASGHNDVNRTKNASRHAEMIAIEGVRAFCARSSLSEKDVFGKCLLYVTAEPCVMCAAALRLVGLNDVFFACANQRFGGCGSRLDVHAKEMGTTKTNCSSPSNKRSRRDVDNITGCNSSYGDSLKCTGGVLAEEAVQMLKLFYAGENPNAPQPKDKTSRKVNKASD